MKHINFSIKNYKGITSLDLNLGKNRQLDIFTLVGLNESGKTTILEAIALLNERPHKSELYKFIPKSRKGNFNENISVFTTYEWSNEDNASLLRFVKTLGYDAIDNIISHRAGIVMEFVNSNFVKSSRNVIIGLQARKKGEAKKKPIEYSNENWSKIVKYIDNTLVPPITYYPDFLFDFPEKIYIDNEETNNYSNDQYVEIIENILKKIDSKLSIQTHLLDRLKNPTESNLEGLDGILNDMGAKVTEKVFTTWEKLFKAANKEIIITHNKEIVNEKTINEKTRYYLVFKLREGKTKFNINDRSLGFKWFFTFLLFTEFRKFRKDKQNNVLFLLDEPASNLHSTAQKKLLSTFSDIVKNSTLIYSTHSHHLINPEWLNGVYVVRNKQLDLSDGIDFISNSTQIEATLYKRFVAKNPDQQDYFQPILDTLDFQPSHLEKVPDIVIVEGKNDYYTLKYFNKVYFDNKYENINIFPGNGADSNYKVIRLYMAWNRDFIVFLDGDSAGERAKKEYIKEFGMEIQDRIITMTDVDSNWKGLDMEKLFDSSELLSITQKFDPTATVYEKSKFNTAIQHSYCLKEKIDLKQETTDKFLKILEKLSNKIISFKTLSIG